MSLSNTSVTKSADDPDPLCDYPSSCQNCVEQIENVSLKQSTIESYVHKMYVQIIVYCVDHIMPTPECVGAIIYASQ